MSNSNGSVRITLEENIGFLTFFHPASNSLPAALLNEIADNINRLSVDERVRVIVLRSEGSRAFCAGASFDELMEIKNEKEGLEFFSGFSKVINAIRKSHKFVIARIQGKAVGGGVGIAAAADYTLALDTASVKLSELALGIGPFVVGPAVERKMGTSAFSELAIDAGNWRTAQWANEQNLYAEVYTSEAHLDDGVLRMARSLAKSSPEAMAELKKIFWKGTENWDELLHERAKISGKLVLSAFTKDFIANFNQKSK